MPEKVVQMLFGSCTITASGCRKQTRSSPGRHVHIRVIKIPPLKVLGNWQPTFRGKKQEASALVEQQPVQPAPAVRLCRVAACPTLHSSAWYLCILGPAGLDVPPESHYSAPLHERAAGGWRRDEKPINTVTICPL